MVLETIATIAAKLFLGEAVQNAALDFGNEVIKTGVSRLKQLVRYKLGGKPELEQAVNSADVELLSNSLVDACQDEFFKNELEKLVSQIQSSEAAVQQPSISESAVGTVASNVSGGQSIGVMNGGVAAERIDNFRL